MLTRCFTTTATHYYVRLIYSIECQFLQTVSRCFPTEVKVSKNYFSNMLQEKRCPGETSDCYICREIEEEAYLEMNI